MIGGIAVALAAAACFECAYVLQALEARHAGGGAVLAPTLLGRLLRRPRWVAGTALALGGAGLQVLALTLAPLTVVQPTLALGLVLLLALSATVLHEPVGRREAIGVGAVVCGVAGVALVAPTNVGAGDSDAGIAVLVALLAVPMLVPFALRARLRDARLRVLAAAAGDALAAVALKLVADALDRGAWGAGLAWAALAAAAGLLALTAEMSALQRIAATRVAPVVLAAQVLVPVLAAPLVFGEHWGDTALGGAVLGLAVLTVASGAALLGASRAVADVIVPDHAEHDVGGDRQAGEPGVG
jgi:drug/metabolite transporter (DMT)-like permease